MYVDKRERKSSQKYTKKTTKDAFKYLPKFDVVRIKHFDGFLQHLNVVKRRKLRQVRFNTNAIALFKIVRT